MVDRRTVLKGGIAFGSLGLASTVLAQDAALVVHEFDGGTYPGSNDLGYWAGAGSFENGDGEVTGGALRLEYDNAGWFASNVTRDVSDYRYLTLRVRGDAGGEESQFRLKVGGVDALLADLTDDAIGTSYSTVSVDLESVGADRSSPQAVRMNFWEGGSSAVEIDRIAFSTDPDGGDGGGGGTPTASPTPTPTDTPGDGTGTPGDETETPDDGTDTPTDSGPGWDVPFPERPPEPDALPAEITAETTVAELCEHFDDPYYVPRDFLDYLPGENASGDGWTDAEKAEEFGYDVEAVQNNVQDGSLTLGDLGTQALPMVQQLAEHDFPAHATVKLLPRLALLPDETEDPGVHDEPQSVWTETAGPAAATNDPDQLIQDRWPTDARSYRVEPGRGPLEDESAETPSARRSRPHSSRKASVRVSAIRWRSKVRRRRSTWRRRHLPPSPVAAAVGLPRIRQVVVGRTPSHRPAPTSAVPDVTDSLRADPPVVSASRASFRCA